MNIIYNNIKYIDEIRKQIDYDVVIKINDKLRNLFLKHGYNIEITYTFSKFETNNKKNLIIINISNKNNLNCDINFLEIKDEEKNQLEKKIINFIILELFSKIKGINLNI